VRVIINFAFPRSVNFVCRLLTRSHKLIHSLLEDAKVLWEEEKKSFVCVFASEI
jgi:hypothetical protein